MLAGFRTSEAGKLTIDSINTKERLIPIKDERASESYIVFYKSCPGYAKDI